MSYQTIAKVIPTMMAVNLVSHNIKAVNKKKTTSKDMLELGVGNMVGVSMLKINADLIGGL